MQQREAAKSAVLEAVEAIGETVLASEAEKDRLRALCDALAEHTPVPEPINDQQASAGVWRSRFASFAVKHSDEQPLQHTTSLRFQSFGKLPDVPAHVKRVEQEIDDVSKAYNNVVTVTNEAGDTTARVIMYGRYSRDEEDPRRYAVAFYRVALRPTDGDDEASLRRAFGLDDDVKLERDLVAPPLHSDIVYVDDDMRINYGKLGGFYVLQREARAPLSY